MWHTPIIGAALIGLKQNWQIAFSKRDCDTRYTHLLLIGMAPLLCLVCWNIRFYRMPHFRSPLRRKECTSYQAYFSWMFLRLPPPASGYIWTAISSRSLQSRESTQSFTIYFLFHAQFQIFSYTVHHGSRDGQCSCFISRHQRSIVSKLQHR
jgi:hypothetical protein